jgi:sec-independent protein translocase protein TatB
MFDIAPTEFLLVAAIALLVIGPKDLPKAMRFVGQWVGRARGVARQFRSGFDSMVREAELAEMEKKWAEENKRIMDEHGAGGPSEATASDDLATAGGGAAPAAPSDGVAAYAHDEPDLFSHPVYVEKPIIRPASDDAASSDGVVPTPPAAATSYAEAGEPASTSASAPKAAS